VGAHEEDQLRSGLQSRIKRTGNDQFATMMDFGGIDDLILPDKPKDFLGSTYDDDDDGTTSSVGGGTGTCTPSPSSSALPVVSMDFTNLLGGLGGDDASYEGVNNALNNALGEIMGAVDIPVAPKDEPSSPLTADENDDVDVVGDLSQQLDNYIKEEVVKAKVPKHELFSPMQTHVGMEEEEVARMTKQEYFEPQTCKFDFNLEIPLYQLRLMVEKHYKTKFPVAPFILGDGVLSDNSTLGDLCTKIRGRVTVSQSTEILFNLQNSKYFILG
jgi:hypothetical protein